jgi:hypothetical protein
MFHLYFGAFDIVLYLGGMYFAIALANALCDQMDAAEDTQEVTATTPNTVAPMQSIPPHLVAPAAKRQDVGVRVSAD